MQPDKPIIERLTAPDAVTIRTWEERPGYGEPDSDNYMKTDPVDRAYVAADALFDAPALTAAADALLKPSGQRVNTVRGRAVGDAQQIIKAAVNAVTGEQR